MPLVREPERLPETVLVELLRSLRHDLEESEALVQVPPARVHDPASLETAADLLRSARAVLDRPRPGASRQELAEAANLAYAVVLAVTDLVKSHTDLPKVPPPRPRAPGTGTP